MVTPAPASYPFTPLPPTAKKVTSTSPTTHRAVTLAESGTAVVTTGKLAGKEVQYTQISGNRVLVTELIGGRALSQSRTDIVPLSSVSRLSVVPERDVIFEERKQPSQSTPTEQRVQASLLPELRGISPVTAQEQQMRASITGGFTPAPKTERFTPQPFVDYTPAGTTIVGVYERRPSAFEEYKMQFGSDPLLFLQSPVSKVLPIPNLFSQSEARFKLAEELGSGRFATGTPTTYGFFGTVGFMGAGFASSILTTPEHTLLFGKSIVTDPIRTAKEFPEQIGYQLREPSGFGIGQLGGDIFTGYVIGKPIGKGTQIVGKKVKNIISEVKRPSVSAEFIDLSTVDTPPVKRTTVKVPNFSNIVASISDFKAIEKSKILESSGKAGTSIIKFNAKLGFKAGKKTISGKVSGISEVGFSELTGIAQPETPVIGFSEQINPQIRITTKTQAAGKVGKLKFGTDLSGTYALDDGALRGVFGGKVLKEGGETLSDFVGTSVNIPLGKRGKTTYSYGGGIAFAKSESGLISSPFVGRGSLKKLKIEKPKLSFDKPPVKFQKTSAAPFVKILPKTELKALSSTVTSNINELFAQTKSVPKAPPAIYKVPETIISKPKQLFAPTVSDAKFPSNIGSGYDTLSSGVFETPKKIPIELRKISDISNVNVIQSKTKLTGITKLKAITSIKQKQQLRQTNDIISNQLLITKPDQKTTLRVIPNLGLSSLTRLNQSQREILVPSFKPPTRIRTPLITPPFIPLMPPPTLIPKILSINIFSKRPHSKRQRFDLKQIYNPSLAGIELGETISKEPKFVSGVGIRPVIRKQKRKKYPVYMPPQQPIIIMQQPSRPVRYQRPYDYRRDKRLPKVMRSKNAGEFFSQTINYLGGSGRRTRPDQMLSRVGNSPFGSSARSANRRLRKLL